ncbi:MAG: DUF2782 domain-containing protein [Thiobacillaceae bacterium]|nr:DUF2782 domain-containing protein [Thiobacillaceae bacterium]MCX7674164.1 DUF2782 domain-containing protein [Thiobacillaceae bacterium]MDW8323593.1 DUF2782 domain-containing protein [Burkholderiales bacterium]
MRTPSLLAAGLMCCTGVALAQPPAGLQPLPEIPPPPGMAAVELEPQVTIVQRGADRVEEYRIRGRLYAIKVTPPHGRPYYLLDLRGDGQLTRHDDLSPAFMVPMWLIHAF